MALYQRRINYCRILNLLLLFALGDTMMCYEKTLRKMVRSQSKMVQMPFNDKSGILAPEDKSYLNPLNLCNRASARKGIPVRRQQLHRTRHTVDVEGGRVKTYSVVKKPGADKTQALEVRSTNNLFFNTSKTVPQKFEFYFYETDKTKSSNLPWENLKSDTRRAHTPFFPSIDENKLQSIETQTQNNRRYDESVVIPLPKYKPKPESDDSLLVKGIFKGKLPSSTEPIQTMEHENRKPLPLDDDSHKLDYLLEMTTSHSNNGGYNISGEGLQVCASIQTMRTNIDAQKRFSEFELEPSWLTKKQFWNSIYNSRYEFLMRNPKWPPLKVILVPRSYAYTIWKNTFDEYNNNSGNKILSNIVKKMSFYNNLTFTWNEVSHLSKWWTKTTQKNRAAFRKFIKRGRLEVTTGGWVDTDEATTHVFGLVHNLIEGHQWLAEQLSFAPDTAWLTTSVSHSPTMTYLLATLGVTKLIFTNVHYSWEEYFAEYQISDFVWVQNWVSEGSSTSELNKVLKRIGKDRYPKNSVLAHYLQFNSDGFKACGPNKQLCATEFNFAKDSQLGNIHEYNIKEKSELILEQYSKTGTLTPHNIILAPIGGPHHFATQEEFDYQYNNYKKIAEYVNINRDIYKATIEFGTPLDYFKSVFQRNINYPSLKGDFLNFADIENGTPAYWTGYFTSRPLLKILLRRLQATLRSTEILFSFLVTDVAYDTQDIDVSHSIALLSQSRETVAQLLDRNVMSGTLSANVLRYVYEKILTTAKHCWEIQETVVSLLTTNKTRKDPYVKKYVYRDGEFMSIFKTVSPGDNVLLFNSLSHERYEVIELFTKIPNIRIIDHNKKDIRIQVNPMWKYNSKNAIVISRKFFKIIFAVLIPPLTIELFKIKETGATALNAATIYCVKCFVEKSDNNGLYFPFNIQLIQKGDIQLESYKHRLILDEATGFLKSVVEKDTNMEKAVVIDYRSFTGSYVNSGVFLFNTNVTKPIGDILLPYRNGLQSKIFIILTGDLTTEFTSVYGVLLQHTVKIFNLLNSPLSSTIFIETKLDLSVSPNNRDVELFMSIQTDINNGYPPEIYIDNNGFQYTPRTVNLTRRIETNMYPMTTLSFIQDRKQRLTVITDHAQGVTALQEGQLVLMLDRRVRFDDGRGTDEGLTDSGSSCQRHYILLENFNQPFKHDSVSHLRSVQLPSFRANYLSNTFNYDVDLFIVDKNTTAYCLYTYIPLIKGAFPCDVALLNYRTFLEGITVKLTSPRVSLLILHRQSFTCLINYDSLVHCDVDPNFSMINIFQSARSIFKSNLAGTSRGSRLNYVNLENFPSMELLTLRIHS